MSRMKQQSQVKIQAKRNVELWIYSFADMYMILSVFFIALAVVYAAKAKLVVPPEPSIPSMGRGPALAESVIAVDFLSGSADLTAPAVESLSLILPFLKGLKKGVIEIEGYADSAPLSRTSPFSSNLDLSNKRAVQVAEWLMDQGVSPARIRTFSYGGARIFRVDGKDVRTNRRVVIKVSGAGGER